MPKSVPKLLIDFYAEAIRFRLQIGQRGHSASAPELQRPVTDFEEAPNLARAIVWALNEFEVHRGPVDIAMSVAGPVAGEAISPPKPEGWAFERGKLVRSVAEFGFEIRQLKIVNDMLACSLALPMLVEQGYSEPLNPHGKPISGTPMLVVCARPNLGACGLVPVPYGSEASDPIWIPALSEPGGMSLYPPKSPAVSDRLSPLLEKLANKLWFSEKGLATAHDFLGPQGTREGFGLIAPHADRKNLTIRQMADDPSEEAGRFGEAWSYLFGQWTRSLALAFGARGGVHVFGETTISFLTSKAHSQSNRQALVEGFTLAGLEGGYLREIPVNFVRHEQPFLEGLSKVAESRP